MPCDALRECEPFHSKALWSFTTLEGSLNHGAITRSLHPVAPSTVKLRRDAFDATRLQTDRFVTRSSPLELMSHEDYVA